jgi:hypothetical protein
LEQTSFILFRQSGNYGVDKSNAKEFARYNILVNAICPAAITKMTESMKDDLVKRIPLNRVGDPEKDIDILRATPSVWLDPIIHKAWVNPIITSRAIIDACKPYEWINEFLNLRGFGNGKFHRWATL